jgi:hypothetical protein
MRPIFEDDEDVTADHSTKQRRGYNNPSRPGVHDVVHATSPTRQ